MILFLSYLLLVINKYNLLFFDCFVIILGRYFFVWRKIDIIFYSFWFDWIYFVFRY